MFSEAYRRLVEGQAGLGLVRFEAESNCVATGRARALLDYCAARRAGRFMPRAAIRPRELLPLLPHLFIASLREDDDVYYRLGGTAIVARLGVEVTGRTAREIFEPTTAGRIIHCFHAMAESGEPMTWRGRYYGAGIDDHQVTETANVPVLCKDGRTVQIFGGVFF